MFCGGSPSTIQYPAQPLGIVQIGTGQSHAKEQASSHAPAALCPLPPMEQQLQPTLGLN